MAYWYTTSEIFSRVHETAWYVLQLYLVFSNERLFNIPLAMRCLLRADIVDVNCSVSCTSLIQKTSYTLWHWYVSAVCCDVLKQFSANVGSHLPTSRSALLWSFVCYIVTYFVVSILRTYTIIVLTVYYLSNAIFNRSLSRCTEDMWWRIYFFIWFYEIRAMYLYAKFIVL